MTQEALSQPSPLVTTSPIDGALLSELHPTALDEIPSIVGRAREAQQSWSQLPIVERVAAMQQAKRRALGRAQELSELIHREVAKPFEEALLSEVLSLADVVDYWSENIENLMEPTEVEPDPLSFPGKRGRIHRFPRGVVAIITPWNYPFIIPLRHLVPALLSGNGVVLKPSEVSPRATGAIASLFDGLVPAGLVSVVQGTASAGAAVVQEVDAVCFTGGVASGKKVAVACAERLIPCSLELGGNDAAIVLADANIERAARGIAWGAFTNSGQNCASIERVYVEKPIAEAFIRRLVQVTQSLRTPEEAGRMTTLAQADHVRRQLTAAVDAGAQVLAGEPSSGTHFPPTVVRLERGTTELLQEETFGPVLPIVVVNSVDEAIEQANATRYGLTASIWTRRVGRAQKLARKLEAGVVTINNHAFTAALPMAPWSGVKLTGSGVTNGSFALDTYCRPFFVMVDRRRSARELWWYPYTGTLRKVGLQMARLRGGAGFFGRIAALFSLLVLLPKRLFERG